MKSLATSETLNADKSRARARLATLKDFASRQLNAQRCGVVILGAFLLGLSALDAHAQVGNNNPSGPSGIFNGQAGGCGYDPYTGNASRSITDISVAGAVGEYPLALVRTANSRAPSTSEVFAFAGGWNHNYNWILEDSPTSNTQNFQPKHYTIEFPDGRVETFRAVTWDSYYRVRPGADTPAQSTSAGVRERFVPLNLNTMFAYLILPDGGKIEFRASQHTRGSTYYYKYYATAIYDPYGLKTQLVSSTTPSGVWRRLDWVIEPAGRSLHFLYTGTNSPKIASVTASDGRTVNYHYASCNSCQLDQVVYYNNANWTAHYQYCGSNVGQGLPPLLSTADDPMYSGPMKRIAYEYKPATPVNPDGTSPVYGQILRERYYDGTNIGVPVSTLTVGMPTNNPVYRTETRGDGATRVFIYNGAGAGYLAWASDFTDRYASQTYDQTTKYIVSVMDRRGNTTDYTSDRITGNVTQIKYPLTQGDTPNQSQRPTVNYTYTNNYHLYTAQDEGGHTTTITRDGNNRATRIDYPDGGYETFGYDPAHFYQISTHQMTTGGTESFTYDARGLKQTYRNPDTVSGNPTARYYYDTLDRVSDITDVLGTSARDPNHTTSFSYNNRGQLTVTTLPTDNGSRHSINNYYNPDGTMYARTNEIYQTTNYTYDDYRRLTSMTTPVRGYNDNNTNTTQFSYYVNGIWDDYSHTDSNVCWVRLPSGKYINTVYDDNRRKTSVTVAWNTGDAATTSYGYDAMGNMTSVTNPLNRNNVVTVYDERNRPSSITVGGQPTSFTYDTAGRKKTITRANTQVITNVSFDTMNRVLVQSATNISQGNNYNMVTQYEYYAPGEGQPVGFLKTFRDPDLYGTNDKYSYAYDTLGRKSTVTYPAEPVTGVHRTEVFSYDTAGRLATYQNRAVKTQTFHYDALNRVTYFTWNDGLTPRVDFGYDAASRLTSINNANATISRGYFYDNLLRTETETITGGRAKTVSYTYDTDGNRASTQYPAPENYIFNYTYTGRNQLKKVNGWATYDYDTRGNLITRTLDANSTYSDYLYDAHDRVTRIRNFLSGTTRTVNYGYDDLSNDRLWAKRLSSPTTPESSKGEVFRYDLADQTTIAQLDVLNPDQVNPPSTPQTVVYDPNGNRTWFTNIPYVTDNLSQYTSIGGSPLTYRADANLATYSGSTYNYDAQNRLTSVSGPASASFKYDGLNRQVSRTDGQGTTYNVWDGWNLVEEYQGATTTAAYVYGATGLIAGALNGQLYHFYQDGSGSTSHLADSNGVLKEWYRYDLDGTPFFYDANDNLCNPNQSGFNVRHLFTGQQWYGELGLYDLRNRFYSPDIGRFLQPDAIGFSGDATNLYRYCGNNPVVVSDSDGRKAVSDPRGWYTYVVNPGWGRYVWAHGYVPGSNGWCAAGAQILSGGYSGGTYHDVPNARDYWYQGASLTSATRFGTVIATGWQDGGYPSLNSDAYREIYGADATVNHTAIFMYFDKYGNAVVLDQYLGKYLGKTIIPPDQQWAWNEVYVDQSDGPYSPETSGDPTGRGGVVVSASPLSESEQARLNGLARLQMLNNPYWGYLPTTSTTNFAGGRAGPLGVVVNGGPISGSIFGPTNFYSGLDPVAAFGSGASSAGANHANGVP